MAQKSYDRGLLSKVGIKRLRATSRSESNGRQPGDRLSVEQLEPRCLLSAAPLNTAASSVGSRYEFDPTGGYESAESAAIEVAPIALSETFHLHSLSGSTKVVFLDFDGHTTRDTVWNKDEDTPIPNIVTPPFDIDKTAGFSDKELERIQYIWERVAEDFRPFNVDVTTEDPGVDALKNSGPGDNRWGVRIAIGGSAFDWYLAPMDMPIGGVAQLGSFVWDSDTPAYVFVAELKNGDEKQIAEATSHEVGHTLGLAHDGQVVLDPMAPPVDYYPGHGKADVGWAPIMGVGYDKALVQWGNGQYPNANNIEDDLDIITANNGFDYRFDDHSGAQNGATVLESSSTELSAEGIIERSTDVDYFTFTVGAEGEAVDISIAPFHRSPNLDILATLYDSNGTVIATSNPVDKLNAEFGANLSAGTYFVAIDGTGRVPAGAMDFGYSDYASLGYYSITGTKKSLLVGVDFDVVNGDTPENWTLYTGSTGPAVFSDLQNEAGFTTRFNLAINSTAPSLSPSTSVVSASSIPTHTQPLAELGGYIADTTGTTLSFEWSDLQPLTVYEVFVFGLSGLAGGGNDVEIVGLGEAIDFTQPLTPDALFVNGQAGSSTRDLDSYSLMVTSSESGIITINVANAEGSTSTGLGGLAIRPAKPGSIQGRVWNDLDNDRERGPAEPGLGGWLIYIDENDNGTLDSASREVFASTDVPQTIDDYQTVKSQLEFDGPSALFDVDVTLDITHSFAADLEVFLISPAGTRVELFNDAGRPDGNFTNTTLDDEAETSIQVGLAPFEGSFRPLSPLSVLDGEDPNGIWTLEIKDDAEDDAGVLNSWSLSITVSEPSVISDSTGSYRFRELPPGTYTIREVHQDNWLQTYPNLPMGDPRWVVDVGPGESVLDIDFGNRDVLNQSVPSSIAGQVWQDLDGNGVKDTDEAGLPGWTIYFDGNDNGMLDVIAEDTIPSTDAPRPIENLSTITSQIFFTGLSTISDVNVTFDIEHTFDADLNAYLISPSGTRVELFTGVGGGENNFQNTTLDDEATTPITSGFAPFAGSYRSDGLLSDFDGEDPNGFWILEITDDDAGDTGSLNSWSLTITGTERSTTTDAEGDYAFEDMVPGTYIIRQVQQPGWAQTFATPVPILLELNEAITNANFGNRMQLSLPGDYNSDDAVDLTDYVMWRKSLNQPVPPFSGADGDGDGVVDQDDYVVWRAHFGMTLSAAGNGSVAQAAAVETPVSNSQSATTSFAATTYAKSQRDVEALPTRGTPTRRPILGVDAETASRQRSKSHINPRAAAAPHVDDAALLAWLAAHSTGGSGEQSSNHDWHEEQLGAPEREFCESIDQAFESLGRRAML